VRNVSISQAISSVAALPNVDSVRIGIVGLGYVGLPAAVHMARHFPAVGYDTDSTRVDELTQGVDRTNEVSLDEFLEAKSLHFAAEAAALKDCNFYIVAVPTPIDEAKRPDLTALQRASETIGQVLDRGDVVVYESTVYPGATEEVCARILERASGLTLNTDFFVGYSPERINPGDMQHRLTDVVKITSGSTPEAADLVDAVYARVISAGTHRTSSIRVAEAAKVIENIQRDVNIALVNELAILFKKLGLETREVLEAAGSKWNFHPYAPGLVGGHCIGVDPYYLTHKAQSVGFHPDIILAGRRINDGMATFIADDIVRSMLQRKQKVCESQVLVMGFTFKENCPDIRNTKVADLVCRLGESAIETQVYDPLADPDEARRKYGISLHNELPAGPFDAIVLAVNHDCIRNGHSSRLDSMLKPGGLIYDIKGVLPLNQSHRRI
jgi:UDP-N-acetyl-D-glucosamine/UDP-N-acetyl-D-galactosamine dehydrogenase